MGSAKTNAASGPVAFWFINDEPRPETMLRQLDELAAKGFSAVVIHPRDGMSVPYLSRRWFDLQAFVIDAAARRGLGLWFYDENPFPSGTAGGMLLNAHPELAGHTLEFKQEIIKPKNGVVQAIFPKRGRMLRFYAAPVDDDGARCGDFADVTDWAGLVDHHWFVIGECNHTYGPTFLSREKSDTHWRAFTDDEQWSLQWEAPEDRPYLVLAVWQIPQKDTRHGYYVDLLNPRTTEIFIELTHQRSLEQLGAERFGTFAAAFTDEPKLCEPYPWTASLPVDYQTAWGQGFWADLPLLLTDAGLAGEAARLRYRRLLGRLWTQRYFQPIGRWCEKNGLAFTGHISPEEDPVVQAMCTPGWMQATAAMHWPGCDQISSRFGTLSDSHRIINPKLASSVAHQHGREHVMVEALGVSGEGITLERMRRILDCLSICGCDRIAIHGQMYSMAGNRKREAPPSIFVQQPYWRFMGDLSEHVARWGQWLGRGKPVRPIALLYPTAVFESRMPGDRQSNQWALDFTQFVGRLMAAGLDFDLVSDVDLADAALTHLEKGMLGVGQARYETLVIPALPILDAPAAKAIEACQAGGLDVSCLNPVRIAGSETTLRLGRLMDDEPALIQRLVDRHRQWLKVESDQSIYVNTRQVGQQLQRAIWNPSDQPVRLEFDGLKMELEGGALHMIDGEPPCENNLPNEPARIKWRGGWKLTAHASNTLRLGRWQMQTGDGRKVTLDIPTKSGFFPLGDGEGASPSQPENPIAGVFPAIPTGGEAVMETDFELEGSVENLRLSWDRQAFAAKAKLWLNDQPVNLDNARTGELPDSLELPVGEWVRIGSNRIRLAIGPLHTDQAALGEPLYLCGDFHATASCPPRIRPATAIDLQTPQDWSQIGFPHYSGEMSYGGQFRLSDETSGVWLQASAEQRDPFEVRVNGQSVGQCCWQPWRIDLTEAMRPGINEVELIVANTLINRIEGRSQPSGLLAAPRLLVVSVQPAAASPAACLLTSTAGRDD